jgi:hypothetical protein
MFYRWNSGQHAHPDDQAKKTVSDRFYTFIIFETTYFVNDPNPNPKFLSIIPLSLQGYERLKRISIFKNSPTPFFNNKMKILIKLDAHALLSGIGSL